jgi:hypothetical protein
MNLRRIVSLLLVFSFILLLITGIVLYIVPAGRIAYWADWKFIGLTKEQWGNIHIISGILGLIAGAIHIFYNWKAIILYLKNRKKEIRFFNINFNLALIITVVVLAGTYFNIPPISYVFDYSEDIKDSATEKYGEPPYSHAELSTIKQFCKTMQIDLDQALENLKTEEINFNNVNDVLKDVASNNNVSPQQLYLIIRAGSEEKILEIPYLPPAGTGKKTLQIFCEQYNLDQKLLLNYLAEHKIIASKDMKLKDIAETEQIEMIELYNMLKSFADGQEFTTSPD